MKFLYLFYILLAYKRFLIQVLFFEVYYLLIGYKQSSIKILNNDKFTDYIPCPYFFLYKIKKFLLTTDIKSLIDLGCGAGSSLYYFNKQLKINYYGVEYQISIYDGCKKLFQKYDNIKIFNDDFMSFKFIDFNNDCFFINDPLKKIDDFNKLILNIFNANKQLSKVVYFILINVDENKRKIFDGYRLIDSLQTSTRGYYIYSNEKINENSKY